MKLLLFLAFVVSCWAAATMSIEDRVQKCGEAVAARNFEVARKLGLECLKIVRTEKMKLWDARRECRKLGEQRKECKANVKKDLKRYKRARKQVKALERCIVSFKDDKGDKLRACASEIVFGVSTRFQPKPIISGPVVVKQEKLAVKALKDAVKSAENNDGEAAGDAAIKALREQLNVIKAAKAACKTQGSCLLHWDDKEEKLRKEAGHLAEIEKCVAQFQDKKLRMTCMGSHRKELLKLLNNGKKKVTKAEQRTPMPRVFAIGQGLRRDVDLAFRSDSIGTSLARLTIMKVIKRARKEYQNYKMKIGACVKVKNVAIQRACKRNARQGLKEYAEIEKLLKKVKGCTMLHVTKSQHINCAMKYGRKLLKIVDPMKKAVAPASLPRLEKQEMKKVSDLRKRIRTLRKDRVTCKDEDCKQKVDNAILVSRVEIHSIDSRYSPRRVCMMQRRRMRNSEFRARALEHLRLYEVHRSAARCQTRKCAKRFNKRQHTLERRIRKSRADRAAAWNMFRCPVVLPKTTEVETTTEVITSGTKFKFPSTDKPVSKNGAGPVRVNSDDGVIVEATTTAAPTVSPGNLLRANLHKELEKIYETIDACPTESCKRMNLGRIRHIKHKLKLLDRQRAKVIASEDLRHRRRAALNKKLNKLYVKAAGCETRKCRKETRKMLKKYQKALAAINRNALGSKISGKEVASNINKNEYVRLLKGELSECKKGKEGRKCRRKVFDHFRRKTEKRDAAVLEELRARMKEKVAADIKACALTSGSKRTCVEAVKSWEARRIAQLQARLIRLEERRSIRMCDVTSDPSDCRKAVKIEFKKDKVRAEQKAKEVADKDVEKLVKKEMPELKARAATSAASSIKVTMGVIIASVLAVLMTV